jgi:hypothetical protein
MSNLTSSSLNADIKKLADFLKGKGYPLDVTCSMFPLRIVCPERGGLAGFRHQHGRWMYLLVFDDFFLEGEKEQIEADLRLAIKELKNA